MGISISGEMPKADNETSSVEKPPITKVSVMCLV